MNKYACAGYMIMSVNFSIRLPKRKIFAKKYWSICCIGLYLNRVTKYFGPIKGRDTQNKRPLSCFFPNISCTGARADW